MKDIIRKLELNDLETAKVDETLLLLLKVRSIVRWMENACDKEAEEHFRILSHTIERYVLVQREKDKDKAVLGIIFPIVRFIEDFYNQNAEKYEPEQTQEEIHMSLIGGELLDTMCKIQTMEQHGWRYGGDTDKAFLFHGFNLVAEAYVKLLQEGEILEKDICDKIEKLNNSVNTEFNKFYKWNQKQKTK